MFFVKHILELFSQKIGHTGTHISEDFGSCFFTSISFVVDLRNALLLSILDLVNF